MKKIIVTGGLGFIGSNLIDLLLKKNYKVLNIDKITYSSNFYNTKEFSKSRNYKFIKCDINNKKIYNILKKYKPICVYNLAAETHVDRSIDNPDNFIRSNIVGVFNLLECFKKFTKKLKIKLIHISTDEVYGDIHKGRSNENFPYNPSSPYSSSKASADHLVKSYIRTYNLNDYQVIIRSTKGLCVNSDLSQEKNKSLILILTECIKNPNSNQLIRRPISSIITVKLQQESGLNSYSKISDFIKSTDVKLNYFFNISDHKIIKSYQ